MASHYSTLAWKIPWTEEPAAVRGVAKSRVRLSDFTFTFHFHALEKEMATHSSVLAWRIPGAGEPGGLPSMGFNRARHDWSDLAAAAALTCHFISVPNIHKLFARSFTHSVYHPSAHPHSIMSHGFSIIASSDSEKDYVMSQAIERESREASQSSLDCLHSNKIDR